VKGVDPTGVRDLDWDPNTRIMDRHRPLEGREGKHPGLAPDGSAGHQKMSLSFSLSHVSNFVLSRQHLSQPATESGLERTVRDVGGLHSTSASVPYLSLRARHTNFDKTQLQRALYEERSLAKVLCMRNTLFILPKELLPVAYQATKKRRDAHLARYLRHYGFTRQGYERSVAAIKELMGTAALTAAEIKAELRDSHLDIVVDLMPNDWQLVRGCPRGSWRSNLHEYSSFPVWFPDVDLLSVSEEEAQERLVQHYLSALGPATEEDIAWWAGLGKTAIRRAIAGATRPVTEIEIKELGAGFLMLEEDVKLLLDHVCAPAGAALLPSLDPYVMGYRDRTRFLDPGKHHKVFDRAGNALPTVWHDGQVIGVWMEDSKRACIAVLLFDETDNQLRGLIEEQAGHLSRFLEHDQSDIRIGPYPDDVYPKTPFSLGRKGEPSVQEEDHD
jgi:hypothetical protein